MQLPIAFALLALVAAYSCEAAYDTYSSLNTTDPATNFFNKVNITAKLVDAAGVERPEAVGKFVCPILDLAAGTDSCVAATYENGDYVQASFNTTGMKFAGGMTPETVLVRACYSVYSATNRKWRKFYDSFKKDQHCRISKGEHEGNIEHEQPFVDGLNTVNIELPDHTPAAFMSLQLYVQCAGQTGDSYCAVSDSMRKYKTFFKTTPVDSISNTLKVATLICAFIGPVCLFAYMAYEQITKKRV